MKDYCRLLVVVISVFISNEFRAQTFTPITVTGFNQDAIAEGAPSTLATTTKELDAIASNKVMYSQAFASFAGIGGGLPDNGTIINGSMTFQLANYTVSNALYVYRGETKSLALSSPASYTRIRILCFATEANVISGSLVNVSLSFTDGSTVSYITNYNLADWFNGTVNQVVTGFGRCSRVAAAPWNADGLPTNPRMYYIDITLSCGDSQKLLQQVNFSNVTTAGTNAPFPNQVFMAVSGVGYSINVTDVISPSDCSGPNGSIALTVTGNSSPYTYLWNTIPAQTGATATGLPPGTYTCTITDINGCTRTYTGTVTLNNNAAMTATATPPSVCPGGLTLLSANVTTGTLTSFTWTPGSLSGSSITVSPATTTTYTVTGTNAIGCNTTVQVTVTVNSNPSPPVANNVTVCSGANATLQVQSPQPGYIYNWYSSATGGSILASGTSYVVNNVTANTSYYVEAISNSSCTSITRTQVDITVQQASAPSANTVTVCPGTSATLQVQNPQTGETYNWYAAATGGPVLSSGNSFTVPNVLTAVTYYVETVTSAGCVSPGRTPVNISLYTQMGTPVVSVLNVSFNSITFSWLAIPGATGYEVSTDGGISFQSPSSGTLGLTHIVSGLQGNQTVSLVVRTLGPQACQTSPWSAMARGTTLGTKEIFVPNVFTPNNDGRNDVLKVYGNLMSGMRFNIFNQWGELIFSTQTVGSGWDGTYKGKQQPVGVYAYTLSVTLQDGTIINKKGAVNLVR
jgi:gliding motility-associated-like protein